MFFSRLSTFAALAIIAVSQVAAAPMPAPMRARLGHAAVHQREVTPLDIIPAYVKRQGDINTVPAEVPTKAENMNIIPYKRADADVNTVPAELATKAENGNIVPYSKRDDANVNTVPEELA
ncbi:hypothetical protein EWM64_g1374, partial [Hericium alpestre]